MGQAMGLCQGLQGHFLETLITFLARRTKIHRPCLGKAAVTLLALGGGCSWNPHLWLQCWYLWDAGSTHKSGSQHPFQVLLSSCGHRVLLLLRQPEPALLQVFWLCLGLMFRAETQKKKGEPTLNAQRAQTLLFQSTHFGGREAGDHLAI